MPARADRHEQSRLRRNVGRTLLLAFFQWFLVFVPVAVPFFQSKGLSLQEVFLLQALFGMAILVTELPSGLCADRLGRKFTLVLGTAMAGVGHSVLLVADDFASLAVFEVCLGIAFALVSGADLAMIYDSEIALGATAREQRKVVGRLYGVMTGSEAVAGIACSAILFFASFEQLVMVQVVCGWIPLLIALNLSEPPRELTVAEPDLNGLKHILGHLFNGSSVLCLTFAALSVWSVTLFHAIWLLQKLWEAQGIALQHFGWMWAALCLLSALAGRNAHRLEDRLGAPLLLMMVGLAPVAGYALLDRAGVIGGLVAAALFFVTRGVGVVILRDALNARIPSRFRATANSMTSFAFRAVFALTAPLMGFVHDLWGMSVLLTMLGFVALILFVALMLPLAIAVWVVPKTPVAVGD